VAKTERLLPYTDLVPRDKIQDYIYLKTKVILPRMYVMQLIGRGRIRTITRPRRYGGGMFSRRAWLDEFIETNS
jgi:hypothetical protein